MSEYCPTEVEVIKQLETIDALTLADAQLSPLRFVVSDLLATGLHVLGGLPKVGKSWLMLWLCLKVARGENLWNYECRKGSVLYLCLEDSLERVQSRLLDVTDDPPDNLHFAVMAESLGSGLTDQIEEFLQRQPDTLLIVIDTLQNIRDPQVNANPYANDYRELNLLRALAAKHHIAILCVHHLRKQRDDDPTNMLSGTTGISGSVDTVLILDKRIRTGKDAKLICTGRDIESVELEIEFDQTKHIWELKETAEEKKLIDPIIRLIADTLSFSDGDFTGTATQLAALISEFAAQDINPATLSKKLQKHHGVLLELGVQYSSRRTRNEKIIDLKRVAVGTVGCGG